MTEIFRCGNDAPVVRISGGQLRGFWWEGVFHFLGVRYGTAARFCAPQPETPWSGVRDACTTGDACLTAPRAVPRRDRVALLTREMICYQSEDCLNLNVWTPSLDPAKKRPVIVWLPGGGFHAGAVGDSAAADGKNLCAFGDVVVVAVNHRISILGFLDLALFDPVRYDNAANRGREDLVLALRWIRSEISHFGGDPDNVTLMGHSGGACKIWALMQTPAADGLYHKCVMESGFSGNMVFPKKEHNGYALVHAMLQRLGWEDQDVHRLETMPYDVLLKTYMAVYAEMAAAYRQDGRYRYVGKTVLPNHYFAGYPFDYGVRIESSCIPVIIGSSLGESGWNLSFPEGKYQQTEAEQLTAIQPLFGRRTEEIAALWRAAYPGKSLLDLTIYETMFRTQILRWSQLRDQLGAPCWQYVFALESPMNGGLPAHHGAGVPYWLHNAANMPASYTPGCSDQLEEQMSTALVQFLRTGDPNHRALPCWRPYTAARPETMLFDRDVRTALEHDAALQQAVRECRPWRQFPI